MANRVHNSELVSAVVTCDRCAFNARGKNAQALAAQHHDKNGHRTHVEITTRITYGASFGATRQAQKQKDMFK